MGDRLGATWQVKGSFVTHKAELYGRTETEVSEAWWGLSFCVVGCRQVMGSFIPYN